MTPPVDPAPLQPHADLAANPGPIETLAEWLCAAALLAMIGLIGTEAIVRNVFGGSLQITDEICGYLLVAVTFLSMAVSEAHRAFHRVELFLIRLSPVTRQKAMLGFDIVSLAGCALLTWQLARFTLNAFRTGDVAPTLLQTPLWLPQAAMPLGTLLLCYALVRSIRARMRLLHTLQTAS